MTFKTVEEEYQNATSFFGSYIEAIEILDKMYQSLPDTHNQEGKEVLFLLRRELERARQDAMKTYEDNMAKLYPEAFEENVAGSCEGKCRNDD